MDKMHFLSNYRLKIRTHFDDSYFMSTDDIVLHETKKPLKDFLKYYSPWYQRDGVIINKIEDVLSDPQSQPIKIGEAVHYSEKSRKIKEIAQNMPPKLDPILIATDTEFGKTLVLDSNHTMNALFQKEENLEREVSVIEIKGPRLRGLITDFRILDR